MVFVLFMVATIYTQIALNFIIYDKVEYATHIYDWLWITGGLSTFLIIIAKFFGKELDHEVWKWLHHKQLKKMKKENKETKDDTESIHSKELH